ncbi:hypothetical protein [Paenibacillus kyungheensis]
MSFDLLLLIAFIIVFIVMFRRIARRHQGDSWSIKANQRFFRSAVAAPTSIVPAGHPCVPLVLRLENALPADYAHQLRQRVMTEHPDMTEEEWNWRWVEMRRYFLICALFNQMPMFSSKVDDIWHEMLMFTREYQQFCDRFFGYMLHHSPHGQSVSQPDQRALFDWAYSQLFPITRPNSRLWNGFFNYPLALSTMNNLYSFNEYRIDHSLFNRHTFNHIPEAKTAILYLSKQFQDHNQQALQKTPPARYNKQSKHHTYDNGNYTSPSDNYGLGLSGCAAVYYSQNDVQHFCPAVNQYLPADVQTSQSYNASSSCGTGYMSTDSGSGRSGHHSHGSDSYDSSHSHSGNDSSSSSCSSDSSGSSCGGGGGD